MTIVDFEHLKVTTMTVIVKLKGSVIIETAFPLLNITRLDLPTPIKQTKKFKIPRCNKPGAILSAKFQDMTRGIVKSKTKRSFLNSITIDIATSKKNISTKLSGEKIHMTGPNSKDLVIETAHHIIDHLVNIQKELNYINDEDNEENKKQAIEWLKDNTIGEDYIIDEETQEIIELEEGESINDDNIVVLSDGTPRWKYKEEKFEKWTEGDHVTYDKIICNNKNPYIIVTKRGPEKAVLNYNFFINIENNKGEKVYSFVSDSKTPIITIVNSEIKIIRVKSIVIPKEYPDKYPDIDERIVNFYIKFCSDFSYHHVYCQFLDCVSQITEVIDDLDLGIDEINMAMINYSYSIGGAIDRWELANRIKDRNGFISKYDNSVDHSVTISLPYEIPEHKRGTKRKKKPPCHTFMVYRSGIVTQSGPDMDMMRDAYYLFRDTIDDIKDEIIQKNVPFSLKYIPKYP